jgi:hypothetical protein
LQLLFALQLSAPQFLIRFAIIKTALPFMRGNVKSVLAGYTEGAKILNLGIKTLR